MKTKQLSLLVLGIWALQSCELIGIETPQKEDGTISISFDRENYLLTKSLSASIPDTNKFILTITSSGGSTLYSGLYGAAPLSVIASPGTYTVKVSSGEFSAPKWDCPIYGDTQKVTVKSSETSSVALLCHQINSGIKLNINSQFLSVYPGSSLLLKSSEGKLLYSYSEKRYAFFNPGKVSLIMSTGATDKNLLDRELGESEMLTINIGVSTSSQRTASSEKSPLSIKLDTARNWTSLNYIIGSNTGTSTGKKNSPYSVMEASEHTDEKDVWFYGYIVGGDLSMKSASFKAPFSSSTNILISSKSSVSDRSGCLAVQLVKGDIRDALNLVDHPDNLGKQVLLCGDVTSSYYGLIGLQSLSDYEFMDN